jgi:CDP-diacylglycerol--glycerol-3-phosphate 3-phosphatidyltransferase
MTVANRLTLARLALTPVFLGLLLRETARSLWGASGVFALAALTDTADGYLARRTGTVTTVGRALDPLADKLLVASALLAFLRLGTAVVEEWMVGAILAREVVVTALRPLAARRGLALSSSRLAKWKTTAQMGFVLALLSAMSVRAAADPDPAFWKDPGDALRGPLEIALLLTTLLTLLSGIEYVWKTRAAFGAAPGAAR